MLEDRIIEEKILPSLDRYRVKLADYPSEVVLMRDLSRELGFNLFVKKDSELGRYGGNKVRKIEFLIKDAILRVRTRKLLVFGPTGSHHVIANLIYGRDFFTKKTVFLFPTHLYRMGDRYVRRNTELIVKFADKVFFTPHYIFSFFLSKVLSMFEGSGAYLIPAGSTSPLSSLGFLFVVDEIKKVIENSEIPEPDYIFFPSGTMGTLSGISLGCALFRLRTKVVGVRVVEKMLCNKFLAKKLAMRTLKKLREIAWGRKISWKSLREEGSSWRMMDQEVIRWIDENMLLLDDFIGRGYGFPTQDGDRAVEFFSKFGLKVERTYTAKTLSALIRLKEMLRGKNVFFYYTLNTLEVN